MSNFSLQDRVFVLGKNCPGTIALMGNTNFSTGFWFGVILDEPIGRNNGCYGGTQYFKCPKNRGIFVRPCQVTTVSSQCDKKDSTQSVTKAYPDYLRDCTKSSKKIASKSSTLRNSSPVISSSLKKRGDFVSQKSKNISDKVDDEKCVLLEGPDGINTSGYGGAHYFKSPKNQGTITRSCQVKEISTNKPSMQTITKINPNNVKHVSTSNPKRNLFNRTRNLNDTSLNSSNINSRNSISISSQHRHEELGSKGNKNILSNERGSEAKSILEEDKVKFAMTVGMENNCKALDFENDLNSNKKNDMESFEMKCLSPELQRFFSKTRKDVLEIKDYVSELDEKLRLLKDDSDKESFTSVNGEKA